MAMFRRKIRAVDPHAEFSGSDPRQVRCSACKKMILMRSVYDTKYLWVHRARRGCSAAQKKGFSNPTLHTFFRRSIPSDAPLVDVPCPGLTRESNEKVKRYLLRTATAGGGAPSRPVLANSMFGATWALLSPKQKAVVRRKEATLYRWRNNRALGAVFSAECLKTIMVRNLEDEPSPCEHCRSLYHLHTFQCQLNCPMPAEENMKYVPKSWRDSELGTLYLKHKGLRELVEKVR